MRHPAEALSCEVTFAGRRFCLALLSSHYVNSGVAVFTEVTPENGADGEPVADIFQDVGTWCLDGGDKGGGDAPAEAAPSVLKVDCLLPNDLRNTAIGNSLMNELIAQIGTDWSDTWQGWPS